MAANAGTMLSLKDEMTAYYRLRGWDVNHVPSAEKLIALGLDEYVDKA